MYKKHFKKWHSRKYNAENEMRAIVRKHRYRTEMGKVSTFELRGRSKDYAEVVRYWRRKGIKIDDVVFLRDTSKTPEAIRCLTPLQSPLKTPENLVAPELVLVKLQDYVAGCFDAGVWKDSGPGDCCKSIKSLPNWASCLSSFSQQCEITCQLLRQSRFREAIRVLSSCCESIKEVLLEEDPQILHVLIGDTLLLVQNGQQDTAFVILRQISAMGEMLYGSCHPLKVICAELASLDLADETLCEEILERYIRKLGDCFEHFLGPLHESTVANRIAMFYVNKSDKPARELLGRCETSFGKNDGQTLQVYLHLGIQAYRQRAFIRANDTFQDILARVAWSKTPSDSSKGFRRQSLKFLAWSHYELGETQAAINFMFEAYNSYYPQNHPILAQLLLTLEGWLAELGEFELAVQTGRRRIEVQAMQESTMAGDSYRLRREENLDQFAVLFINI